MGDTSGSVESTDVAYAISNNAAHIDLLLIHDSVH